MMRLFRFVLLGLLLCATPAAAQFITPQSVTISGDCNGAGAISIPLTCLSFGGVPFGTAAGKNTGNTGATLGLLNDNLTFSGTDNFTGTFEIAGSSISFSSGVLAGANGGTANGFFAVSGPSTSLKTFTFPNANATVLTTNALVTVAQGGIGVGTLASNGILYGNGTSAVQALAVNSSATKKYLQQVSSGAPSWQQVAAADISGLGTAATQNTGTSGANIPLLNAGNTWSGVQAFTDGDLSLLGATSGNSTLKAPATGGGTATLFSGSDTIAGKSVANGGTNCNAASGTCLDNITGFSSTGIIDRTGAGAYSFHAAPSGAIVGTSDTQTLTNKSIDASELTSGTVAAARLPSTNAHTDISTSTTLTASNLCNVVRVDATSSALTETLPASGNTDDCVIVLKKDSSANRVTVNFNGGTAAAWLNAQNDVARFAYWGGAWTVAQRQIAPLVSILSGSGNYTVPPLINGLLEVQAIGGGAGGGGTSPAACTASGGTSGNYLDALYAATPGATIAYAIGAKGTGASAGNNPGNAGSDTTFGTLTAKGGLPGLGCSSGNSAAPTANTLNTTTGAGSSPTSSVVVISSTLNNGAPGAGSGTGGSGGRSLWGAGGTGGTNAAGGNATGNGAGGAGAGQSTTPAEPGGDGTDGAIVVKATF